MKALTSPVVSIICPTRSAGGGVQFIWSGANKSSAVWHTAAALKAFIALQIFGNSSSYAEKERSNVVAAIGGVEDHIAICTSLP